MPASSHRESVFSIISVDSLLEGDDEEPHLPRTAAPEGTKGKAQARSQKPVESPRKRRPTRDSAARRPDDRLVAKRRNIVDEFYETEKAYVDGLDLIYEVSHFIQSRMPFSCRVALSFTNHRIP